MTLAQQWILEGKQVGLLEGEQRGKQVGLIEGEQRGKQVGLIEGKQVGLIEGKQVGLIEGKQVGLIEGKQVGLLEVNKRLMRRRFQMIPADILQALEQLDSEQLSNFSEALFDFTDLTQVRAWLTATHRSKIA
ncbi:MAG: DUF4351 domain-containing protein [Anaerolineae bacterium]|nr:DUF4351 domain-containing protein [Anaerolineae bacterium]